MNEPQVTIVTVSYGNRLAYLMQALPRFFAEPEVGSVILVNNGIKDDLSPLISLYGARLDIVDLPHNMGSAAGYGAGLKRAVEMGAPYILLMDDDNAPSQGGVEVLLRQLRVVQSAGETSMVCGSRGAVPDIKRAYPQPSSFMMFHVGLAPRILWQKFFGKSPASRTVPPFADIPFCPYGGLMLERSVVVRHGLPRTDFVLYSDDHEYTLRLTKLGVRLRLSRDVRIEDLEQAWTRETPSRSNHWSYLHAGADFRVYYTFRNTAYVDRNLNCSNLTVYLVNRAIYMTVLWLYAVFSNGYRRLAIIRRAVAEGEAGRLGYSPDFPLP